MDQLANKTAYGSPEWKRARSGARQGLAGLGLLALAYVFWVARASIPALATTEVMATAILSTLHDGSEIQLQRAFAAVKFKPDGQVTFERGRKPSRHGVSYYLSVTADTPERAKVDLATFTDGIRAAFPSAERNLMVSLSNSTVPAPNALSRRISLGVHAAVVLLMLGAQLLIVIGAYREGMGRVGLFAAIATPFAMLIFPSTDEETALSWQNSADWKFVLLLLAITPVSVILGLWLTRRSRRTNQFEHETSNQKREN